MMRRPTSVVLGAALATLIVSAPHASTYEVIGEWVDSVGEAWRHNIKIVSEDGSLFRISTFQDGSTNRGRLIQIAPKTGQRAAYKDVESAHGEVYAIDEKGDLLLYDREGFIRKARRVP